MTLNAFNGINAINAGVNRPATPPHCSLGPYKRRAPSLEFTAPLPAHTSLSPRLSNSLTERRPPRRRSSPGEALIELPVPPSPFCAPASELWRTGAAGG
jgi:hypothetical protein